jgi:hypothetical protein
MATSAAESRSQTESLFAENNEPFFNTIDPKRIFVRFHPVAVCPLMTDAVEKGF